MPTALEKVQKINKMRKQSQAQERRIAKEAGGRVQVASGAIQSVGLKGDVRTGVKKSGSLNDTDYLIENKCTSLKAYVFKKQIWLKIAKEAMRDSLRIPALQIDIQENCELIIVPFEVAHDKFRRHSVLIHEADVKNSIAINREEYMRHYAEARNHKDMLIVKLYIVDKNKRKELALVNMKDWEW